MDGYTIYGFEEDNLMSKNALADLDMWKEQAESIMKGKIRLKKWDKIDISEFSILSD